MASSSRSFRKIAACVLVLCCLGGAAWYFLPEKVESTVESARNAVRNLTGKTTEKTDEAGTPADVSSASSAAGEENTPRQVGAALTTEGRPEPVDPQAELLARVDRAMTSNGAAAPDGDSASGKVTDQAPAPAAEHRDSVVTPRFVSDMAGWLASKYIPSHHEGRGGRSSVTLVQANARYSNSGTLRSVERDPLKSRSSILNYVFTPGMLEALYRMYSPAFIEEMERSARASRKTPLTDAQVADMFEVYAEKFRRLAVSLDASAAVDLPALSAAILREAGHESDANESFARAYMALSLAREHGDRDEIAIQSRRMAESTRVAGMYADRQERARNDMVYAICRKAEGQALSSAELLFLGEWLSRRGCSVESMQTAANVCRRMAEQMTRRADDILHHRESDLSAPAPSEAGKSAGTGAENAGVPKSSAAGNTSSTAAPESASPAPAVEPASAGKAAEAGKSNEAPSSAPSVAGKSPAGKPSFPEVSGRLNRNAPAPASPKAPAAGNASSSAAPEKAPAAEQPAAASTPAATSDDAPTASPAAATVAAPAEGAPEAAANLATAPASAQNPANVAAAPAGDGQNAPAPGSGSTPADPKAPAVPASTSGSAEAPTASSQSPAGSAQPAAGTPAVQQEKPAGTKAPAAENTSSSAAPEKAPAAEPSAAASTPAAASVAAPTAAPVAAPAAATVAAPAEGAPEAAANPASAPASAQSPANAAAGTAPAGDGQNAAR